MGMPMQVRKDDMPKHPIYDHALGNDFNWTFAGLGQDFGSWWTDTRNKITGAAKQTATQATQQVVAAADAAKQQAQQQATAMVQGAIQQVGVQAASTIQSKVAQISANPLVQKYAGQAVDKSAASAIASKIEPVVTTVRQNIKPIAIVAGLGLAYLLFMRRK